MDCFLGLITTFQIISVSYKQLTRYKYYAQLYSIVAWARYFIEFVHGELLKITELIHQH